MTRVDTDQEHSVWTPEAIRALRARFGLSQQAFSERLGVAVTTVSRWEQGHKSPVGHLQRALDDLAASHHHRAELARHDRDSGEETER